MYDIKETLQKERVRSLKARDKERATFLSTMLSEIKSFEINNRSEGFEKTIKEEEAIAVFNKMLKSRKESIVFFENNGRNDLLEKEKYQIDIISEFVPAKMTETEIEMVVKDLLNQTELKTMKNMMPILKSKFGQNADMAVVRKTLEKLIN